MLNINIRPATFADLPVLLEFEQAIIDIERQFDPTLKASAIHYFDLKGMINAKAVKLLVAVHQGKIIGSGFSHIMDSEVYLKHQKNGYFGFMYVRPEFRRQGVNRQIIEALKQWSLAQNVTEIRLDVYQQNRAAINGYEKLGFKANLLEMRLELGLTEIH